MDTNQEFENISIGTEEECCNTCVFGIFAEADTVLCLDKGERRPKRSVCLDWNPKET